MAHGKLTTNVANGTTVTLGGPIFWAGDPDEAPAPAQVIWITAAFAGQSATPPLLASMFVEREVTDHEDPTEWEVVVETDTSSWDPPQMAASVLALVTSATDPTLVTRECWNWHGAPKP
jgi:hypothetical protein